MELTSVEVSGTDTKSSIHESCGKILGAADGFYGRRSHLLTTQPQKALLPLAWIHSRDLTVCYAIWPYMRHLAFLTYAILLQVILGQPWAFPLSARGEPPCPANGNMCGLEEVLLESTKDFRLLIAFVLGGYVAGTVGIWRTRRTNYASLCGNARNLNVQMAALLPTGPPGSDASKLRHTLARWVTLAFELAMLKARGQMDADASRDYLTRAGLLEADEWEAMVAGDRHTTVFWWVLLQLQRVANDGMISPEALHVCSDAVRDIRAQANDLMSSLDRDQPFPYMALLSFLVTINVTLFTSWKGVLWAQWFHKSGGGIYATPKMYVELLTTFLWNISYVSMYDLCYVLHNPFKARRLDVAHDTIGAGIRKLAEALAAAEPHVPKTMAFGSERRAASNKDQ